MFGAPNCGAPGNAWSGSSTSTNRQLLTTSASMSKIASPTSLVPEAVASRCCAFTNATYISSPMMQGTSRVETADPCITSIRFASVPGLATIRQVQTSLCTTAGPRTPLTVGLARQTLTTSRMNLVPGWV